MAETYNGWTNYETWNVALWIGDDYGSHEYWSERAREIYANTETDEYFERERYAAIALADEIKDQIDESNPLADGASLYSDILGANLSSVNYFQIAASFIDSAREEA